MSELFTIAFLGLGNMGGPMAANLINAGHAVRGFEIEEHSLNSSHLARSRMPSSA